MEKEKDSHGVAAKLTTETKKKLKELQLHYMIKKFRQITLSEAIALAINWTHHNLVEENKRAILLKEAIDKVTSDLSVGGWISSGDLRNDLAKQLKEIYNNNELAGCLKKMGFVSSQKKKVRGWTRESKD